MFYSDQRNEIPNKVININYPTYYERNLWLEKTSNLFLKHFQWFEYEWFTQGRISGNNYFMLYRDLALNLIEIVFNTESVVARFGHLSE